MALKAGIKFSQPIDAIEVDPEVRRGDSDIFGYRAIGINRQSARGTVVDETGFPVGSVGNVFADDEATRQELEGIYREYIASVEAFQARWDAARAKLTPITEETR